MRSRAVYLLVELTPDVQAILYALRSSASLGNRDARQNDTMTRVPTEDRGCISWSARRVLYTQSSVAALAGRTNTRDLHRLFERLDCRFGLAVGEMHLGADEVEKRVLPDCEVVRHSFLQKPRVEVSSQASFRKNLNLIDISKK